MAQLDVHLTGDQSVASSTLPGQQLSFMEIDHELLSGVILSLPLIPEELLSASGLRMQTILVNRLQTKPAQLKCSTVN